MEEYAVVLYWIGTRFVIGDGAAAELQQKACEVFEKMPQRKPSPPESANIAATAPACADDAGVSAVGPTEAFRPQQSTSCFPPASMAQNSPSPPRDAAIGPIDPNPHAVRDQSEQTTVKTAIKLRALEDPESAT